MPRRERPAWARPSEISDLLRLAIPVAASRAAIPVMSLTDVAVLGQNAVLELPYITNGYLVVGIGLAIGMGVLQGVQVMTAELSGVGRASETGRVLRRGVHLGLLLGVAFTVLAVATSAPLFQWLLVEIPGRQVDGEFDRTNALSIATGTASATNILAYGLVFHMMTVAASLYLEALRKPRIVTAMMYAGVIVNLVLNLALVAGWWGLPRLGADGVAWATTGTRIALTLAFAIVIWQLTPGFTTSPQAPVGEAWRQNTVGAGGAIANVAEFSGFNLTFIIATWSSIVAATLYGLAIQPVFLTFMMFVGLGTATSVRVAEAFGRKDRAQVQDASRLGIVACAIMGLALAVIVWLGQDLFALLLVRDDPAVGVELVAPLAGLIGLTSAILIFDGLQGVGSMALRAQEVVWLPAAIQIGSYFLIMLPAAYAFGIAFDRGAWGVLEGVLVASVVAGLGQTALLEWKTARHRLGRAPLKET